MSFILRLLSGDSDRGRDGHDPMFRDLYLFIAVWFLICAGVVSLFFFAAKRF
ncbi:MAG: hypothetical protein AB1733_17200 [Thermodesulfobacteriota bacterium]